MIRYRFITAVILCAAALALTLCGCADQSETEESSGYVDPLESQYRQDVQKRADEYRRIFIDMINEDETEYSGENILNENTFIMLPASLASQDIEKETFEMVKGYGYATDIDEPIYFTIDKNKNCTISSKWKKEISYINDCYELNYSDIPTDYEKYLIYKAMDGVMFPSYLNNKEVNDLFPEAKEKIEEIIRSNSERVEREREEYISSKPIAAT